jgi:hypothetical protein
MTAREDLIADTFVELADTLVAEFDLIDFLHTLVERMVALLDVDAGGIMLADQRGGLEVLAASTHEVRLVELFELQNHEGPCLEAFRTGEAVTKNDLAEMRAAWPSFTTRLEQAGFSSAQAVLTRAARGGHRCAERLPDRARLLVPGGHEAGTGSGRRRHGGIAAGKDHPRSRAARRAVAACAEQPRADRTGQGSARRTIRPRGRPGVRRHAHPCPAQREPLAHGRRRHRPRSDPAGREVAGRRGRQASMWRHAESVDILAAIHRTSPSRNRPDPATISEDRV